MEILAIIPARGGSKSVPRKNIRLLAGMPLIAYAIIEAKKSKYITRVIVSTDDEEIANVAKQYDAEIPFLRPKEISGDYATDVEFINHALDFLEEKEGYKPEIILRLPPTSPLRSVKHIDEGIEVLLKDPNATACRPITQAPKHPYKMWKIADDSKYLEPFLPKSFTNMDEPYNMPRQKLPSAYVHTGAMDIIRYDTVKVSKSTSGDKLAYFFMREEDSVNIDTEFDFQFAEFLITSRGNKND